MRLRPGWFMRCVRHTVVVNVITLLVYIVVAFAKWNIMWCCEIPRWSVDARCAAICLYIIFNIALIWLADE